ncbi:MAG: hypothetical protein ABH811_02015 [archaeon]
MGRGLILVLIGMIVFVSGLVSATDYYVSPTGTALWSSCTNINTPCSLATANQNAQAGDVVNMRGGSYLITSRGINPTNNGAAGNRITYEAYNGESVELIGDYNFSYCVYLGDGQSYITIKGINCTNFYKHMYMSGGARYNEIAYCSFIGMYDDANSNWWGSALKGSANNNWIHHSTFAKYGNFYNDDDKNIPLEIGWDQGTYSEPYDNVIEECHFYSGGHHALGVMGFFNVLRNCYLHNENWFEINSTLYGDRTLYLIGMDGHAEHNLVENNRIAYGGQTSEVNHASGVGLLLSQDYTIVRFNEFARTYIVGINVDYAHGACDNSAYRNSIYHNTFWYCGYYENSLATEGKEYFGTQVTHAIVVDEVAGVLDTLIANNLFYQNKNAKVAGEDIIESYDSSEGGWSVPDDQEIRGNWLGVYGDPKFVDIIGTPDPFNPDQYDFNLMSDSPCINKGSYLTQTNGAGSDSVTLIVDNAYPFQDGWGNGAGGGAVVQADWIAIGSVDNVVQIKSIDYDTNTITLTSQVTWNDNDPIWLYKDSTGRRVLYGDAPDIGAFEFVSDGGVCGGGEQYKIIDSATIQACSCEQTDVQAAIDAADAGDTVKVPAGSCTWETLVADRAAVRIIDKSIKLKGSGIDKTIIIPNTQGGWGLEPRVPMIIKLTAGKNIDISDFSIDMKDYSDTFGFFYVSGSGKSFRLHDMKFFSSGSAPGRILRIGIGKVGSFLIDNNEFLLKSQAMWIDSASYDGEGSCSTSYGDDSFCSSYSYGTNDGIFLEDNEFKFIGATDTVSRTSADVMGGARLTYRYNNCTDTGLFTHGYETNQRLRGPRVLEVYNNNFHRSYMNWNSDSAITIRGGTGIFAYNVIDNNAAEFFNSLVKFDIKRLEEGVCSGCQSACDGFQSCDGNTIPTGYPCRDQPGFGFDTGFTSSQTSEPIYIWDNALNGIQSAYATDIASEHVILNRDYILSEKPGYTPYIYPHPLTIAPFGTNICGEGEITTECWCEGLKTTGVCNNGYYSGDSCLHEADLNCDGKVDIKELIFFITKYNNGEVTISELTSAIDVWKGF